MLTVATYTCDTCGNETYQPVSGSALTALLPTFSVQDGSELVCRVMFVLVSGNWENQCYNSGEQVYTAQSTGKPETAQFCDSKQGVGLFLCALYHSELASFLTLEGNRHGCLQPVVQNQTFSLNLFFFFFHTLWSLNHKKKKKNLGGAYFF